MFTVLMPVYNGDRYIADQIDSIIEQSFGPHHIVIIDDGSTDTSRTIIENYRLQHSNITFRAHKSNVGLIQTITELLGLVETKYWVLADQDDIWLPNKLYELWRHLEDDSEAGLCYSDMTLVDENGRKITTSFFRNEGVVAPHLAGLDEIFVKNCISGNALAGRTSLIKYIIPFPIETAEHDRWIALVACAKSKVKVSNDKLVLYRQHAKNAIGANGFFGRIRRLKRENFTLKEYLLKRMRRKRAYAKALVKLNPLSTNSTILRVYGYPKLQFVDVLIYIYILLFKIRHVYLRYRILDVSLLFLSLVFLREDDTLK